VYPVADRDQSVLHTAAQAVSETTTIVGTVVTILGVGAPVTGSIPADAALLAVLTGAEIALSGAGTVADCFDKGWTTLRCSGGVAAAAGSTVTGASFGEANTQAARVAVQAGGFVWNRLSGWASR
jgi:hypothetical protein